jgi:4-amino-4-deoxy-L-arabinose transferase-like glycosyltransferase
MAPESQPTELSRACTLRQAALSGALAILLAAVVLLTLLGHNRLTDWDEGIYAQISREMLRNGFLIPHWNLQPWLEKPPLMLWVTALFFKLFGVFEFTARLGSALSGVALSGLLNFWLALRHSRLAAWLSTLILLSTSGFLHVARVGEMDVLLSLGITLALIGLAELHLNQILNLAWYLFWIGFAIALMTKGAAGITLLFTAILFLALEPTLLRRLRTHFFLGLLLFLALVLPWHLYMLHRFGQLFVDQYLGLHVLARATSQIEGHLTPWWFYLRVLLLSAAPFLLLYPIALYDTLRQPRLRPFRVFALFALIELLFFTLIQTRLPHYIAPAYPTLSLLTALWLANWISPRLRSSKSPTAFCLKLTAAALALFAIAAALTSTPRKSLHSPRLPNGNVTANNREEVALLKQVFLHPSPAVAATPGPLLDWRPGTYNPIPSTLFYANRPVQQVALPPIPNIPHDKYTFDPIPLTQAVTSQPRLILLDRTLLPALPPGLTLHPLASSPNLIIGILDPAPTSR